MPNKVKFAVIAILLIASLVISFSAGCVLDTGTIERETVSEPEPGMDVIEQAWGIIFRDYVDKDKLDATALSQAAIRGMVEELDDPYTSYMDPQTFEMRMEDIEGSYEGIGAYFGYKDEQLMIIAPILDSPADRAGIRPGDIILQVDGDAADEMTLDEIIFRIRGPKGMLVSLLVLHQGETEPVEIEIIRDEIELSSVYFEMEGDIAYINIIHFTERTNEELAPVMESLADESASGIILDLRSNPGGLLDSLVDVASHFLKEGLIFYSVDNEGERTSYPIERGSDATELPMVVLTDNYTASASEVLAGALQDHARATIAGSRTYGKGSVNLLYQLTDGSGLKITYARWYTPNGRMIEGEGIIPDYELDEEVDAIEWAIDYLNGDTP
ncbi:S41 family peptidase [Chloroflexota bacterium]